MHYIHACIIQHYSHYSLFTHCSLFGQQCICLTLSIARCDHSWLQQSLTASMWATAMSPFQTPLKYEEYLLTPGVSWLLPENAVLFIFRSSANSEGDTRGLLVSKDDKGHCARGAIRHKAVYALSSAYGQRQHCVISHACTIIVRPPKQRLDGHPVREDGASPWATRAQT